MEGDERGFCSVIWECVCVSKLGAIQTSAHDLNIGAQAKNHSTYSWKILEGTLEASHTVQVRRSRKSRSFINSLCMIYLH